MPNFLFEFKDTTIQKVSTVIQADTQEEAEVLFDHGEWTARIGTEVVRDREDLTIAEVGPEEAQVHAWRPSSE